MKKPTTRVTVTTTVQHEVRLTAVDILALLRQARDVPALAVVYHEYRDELSIDDDWPVVVKWQETNVEEKDE